MALSKGSSGRTVLDFEDTYNETRDVADRRPIQVDFNSNTLVASQNQQQAATITGNRAQSQPFLGNKDVTGSVVVPMDRDTFGYFMALAIAMPVSTEDGTPNTRLLGTTPTLGISSGTGTFSAAQTTAVVGDRVVYRNSAGAVLTAWLTGKTSDTIWNVRTENDDAGSNAADTTAATVIGIAPNLAETVASPGTVTIASGVATFSEGQTGAAVGDQVLYDADNTLKRAYLSAKTSDTVWTVVDGEGFPAPDGSGLGVESVEARSFWLHVFTQHATNAIPSATFERRFQDLGQSYIYSGCKINAMNIALGGDGELTAECQIVGARRVGPQSGAYEADSATPAPVRPYVQRYGQFEGLLYEGGATNGNTFLNVNLNLSNNLDTSIFPVGAQGERTDLPEGFAAPSGSVEMLFRDTTILDKATNVTESSIRIRFSQQSGDYYCEFELSEIQYQPSDPPIEGPNAVRATLNFQAYYQDNSNAAAIVGRLRNKRENY